MRDDSWGSGGEVRGSGLWGTKRGGGSSGESRNAVVRRGLLALLVLALAAPLAASAGDGRAPSGSSTYLAPSLERAAHETPNTSVSVIVQSDSAAHAENALERYGDADARLGIVDGASGKVRAGALTDLASRPGLVITPDHPVVLMARGEHPKPNKQKEPKRPKDPRHPHLPAPNYGSNELWPAAVGVDALWPRLPQSKLGPVQASAPTIAFVDSGIESSLPDFGDRVLAEVDLTSLPGNSEGDGSGHGTLVAGIAAGSAAGHTGAAPTAGIVSLDVMDDQGMARTSDVIEAAQWILRNRRQFNIRVANFSLHSATASSFRWDPLDKAVEKLWFAGVFVVTASGNEGRANGPVQMGFAPGNDPFVATVGALDLHNSTNPDQADVPNWSSWGYTFDGFAKPELSAPGRALTGPVPRNSVLAKQRSKQARTSPDGTYITLSGTSLSAPIVAGIAADLLALNPLLSPDQLKGALMLSARELRKVKTFAAGVGEVNASGAASVGSTPNPNRALNRFLVPDTQGSGLVFDDVSWLDAIKASPVWDAVSWLDGWNNAAWSLVSWSDVSWSDVSWTDVSWSDVSWSDVSWTDVSWADTVYDDVG